MKLEWNKVTWYSKVLALIIFVALPFLGFWYGMQYGALSATANNGVGAGAVTSTSVMAANNGSEYYTNTAEWQVNADQNTGFSVAYPIDFDAQGSPSPAAPSADWRYNANGAPGTTLFMLTVPRAFEPQTNFVDARLTVGSSRNAVAIGACLSPDPSAVPPKNAVPTATINGVQFSEFNSADAGAGSYYETTSYRTLRNGTCWAVEYTIHSAQIANYPAEYHLRPFDHAMIKGLLDRIVSTFKFL